MTVGTVLPINELAHAHINFMFHAFFLNKNEKVLSMYMVELLIIIAESNVDWPGIYKGI